MSRTNELAAFLDREGIMEESRARQQISLHKGDPLELLAEIVRENPGQKEKIGKFWGDLNGVAYVNLDRTVLNYELVRLLPREFALDAQMVPLVSFGDVVTIACARPKDERRFQEAENCISTFMSPVFSFPDEIEEYIELAYQSPEHLAHLLATDLMPADKDGDSTTTQTINRETLEGQAGARGVIDFVDGLVDLAVAETASDIHLEPAEAFVRIRFRVDGVLHDKLQLHSTLLAPVAARIKILAGLDISEHRRPQDGRYSHELQRRTIDIRVSTVPAIHGEKVVLRLLGMTQSRKHVPELTSLGLSIRTLEGLHEIARQRAGIYFVTGPTGSGKTTTLFSLLDMLNDQTVNILTIEDPVEYKLDRINQVQVNPIVGLTFASALRSFLRQDPDIILVGEIRDEETARIAVQAALTGHLVLATLHTNSALQAVGRLIDIGVEPFLVAPACLGVMAQRLVRRVCDGCAETYPAPEHELERYFTGIETGEEITFSRGLGCRKCNNTGYAGRIAIAEQFIFDVESQHLIARNATTMELLEYALAHGFRPIIYDGLLKVLCGMTTLAEVERVLGLGQAAIP